MGLIVAERGIGEVSLLNFIFKFSLSGAYEGRAKKTAGKERNETILFMTKVILCCYFFVLV